MCIRDSLWGASDEAKALVDDTILFSSMVILGKDLKSEPVEIIICLPFITVFSPSRVSVETSDGETNFP